MTSSEVAPSGSAARVKGVSAIAIASTRAHSMYSTMPRWFSRATSAGTASWAFPSASSSPPFFFFFPRFLPLAVASAL